jgi:hypothetical protein
MTIRRFSCSGAGRSGGCFDIRSEKCEWQMLAYVLRGIASSIATQVQPLTTPVCALAGGPDRTHCCDDCIRSRRGGYLASPGGERLRPSAPDPDDFPADKGDPQ